MCDDIDRYLLLNVIALQRYRSMPIAQFNRFARVSIDIYWQYNRSARVWIDTYCLQIYTLLLRTTYLYRTPSAIVRMGTLDDSSKYLDVLLAFCFQTADLRQYLVEVLIDDRFVRISIDSCCCCWTTETPLTTFFFEGINHTNSFAPIGQRNRYPSTISPSYYRLQ